MFLCEFWNDYCLWIWRYIKPASESTQQDIFCIVLVHLPLLCFRAVLASKLVRVSKNWTFRVPSILKPPTSNFLTCHCRGRMIWFPHRKTFEKINCVWTWKVTYLKKMDCISNLPLSLTYKWYMVSEPREHLHGRFLNRGLFSSFSWMMVAIWMQRRHDECTAAISTRALKDSDGPSYFHLKDKDSQNFMKVHIILNWSD